ncbi:MAG TPA: DNA repair protein RecO [Thermoanaerobaculia bacterium]|nr:DNA repair protein RecO [Thermoanaerobaculia bacterium]
MPQRRDRAFILSAIPLREKDRIVTFLTEHAGLRRGVARGARRLQSAYAGSLEPMSETEVLWFEKEGRDLHRIDSIEIVRSSFPIAADLAPGLLLSAIAESLITFVPDSDPSEKFFRLAAHAVGALFDGRTAASVAVYFDAWVLKLTGVLPSPAACAACGNPLDAAAARFDETLPGLVDAACAGPGARRVSREVAPALARILAQPISEVPPKIAEELAGVLRRIRRHFLGHELKSQKVLGEVLYFGAW